MGKSELDTNATNQRYGGEPYVALSRSEQFTRNIRRAGAVGLAGLAVVATFGVIRNVAERPDDCRPVGDKTAQQGDTFTDLVSEARLGISGFSTVDSANETNANHYSPTLQAGAEVEVILCGTAKAFEALRTATTPAIDHPNFIGVRIHPEGTTLDDLEREDIHFQEAVQGWQESGALFPEY